MQYDYFQGKPESLSLITEFTTYVALTFGKPLPKMRILKAEAYPMKVVMIQFRFRKANKEVLSTAPPIPL